MIVNECLDVMSHYTIDTRTKLTTCYNLTDRILRLFAIRSEKKWVLSLIEEFNQGIKESVEEYYSEDD